MESIGYLLANIMPVTARTITVTALALGLAFNQQVYSGDAVRAVPSSAYIEIYDIAKFIASAQRSKADQLAGFEAIVQEIKTHYGLLPFKEALTGITFEQHCAHVRHLIETATSLDEFQGFVERTPKEQLSAEDYEQILIYLAALFEDGHFNILRNQTFNAWTLGIYASFINDEFVITGFNDKYFQRDATASPLKEGDEIVSINGIPVDEEARKIASRLSLATTTSRLNLAYSFLLSRPHRWLPATEPGRPVRLRFRRLNPEAAKDPSAPKTFEFEGVYKWINADDYSRAFSYFPNELKAPETEPKKYIFGVSRLNTYLLDGLKNLRTEVSILDLGQLFNAQIRAAKETAAAKASPTLDAETSVDEFQTGLFNEEPSRLKNLKETNALPVVIVRYKEKSIGILRITNYSHHAPEMEWLASIMPMLQAQTDMLIIDQIDNGGGYVWTGEQTLRLFADPTEFKGAAIRFRLNETLLTTLERWRRSAIENQRKENEKSKDKKNGSKLEEPLNFGRIHLEEEAIAELRREFEAGHAYSSLQPYMGPQIADSLFGRIVGREGAVYKKPVVIVNSCRSGSCGDMMPGLMQANGRAIIVADGASMGLGAPVYRSIDSMPGSELFMRLPFGMMYRPDGFVWENLGTVPDIQRNVLAADLRDGFKTYAKDILTIALAHLSGKKPVDIQQEINPKPNDSLKGVIEILDGLKKIAGSDETATLLESYREAFAKLVALDTSRIAAKDWAAVSIPLPSVLLSDSFLASLKRPDEITARLAVMKRLSPFKDNPGMLALMSLLQDNLNRWPRMVRVACFDELKHFAGESRR